MNHTLRHFLGASAALGRMASMKTWQNFANNTGAYVTTWTREPYKGYVSHKGYPDGHGTDYNTSPGGRMWYRWWARGGQLLTSYGYNYYGEFYSQTYSDTTQGYNLTYDRRGRKTLMTDYGTGYNTTTYAYNDAGQQTGETYSGANLPLAGFTVTNIYDSLLRRSQTALKTTGGTTLASVSYTYDNASRLASVSDGTYSANYTYLANSPLVSQITCKQNTTTRMTTTRNYDNLNRLLGIASAPSSALPLNFGYAYNDGNQRVQVRQPDGSYWTYLYDSLGQVISGKRYWADNIPVAGQQYEYGFDDIGNRTTAKSGGDDL